MKNVSAVGLTVDWPLTQLSRVQHSNERMDLDASKQYSSYER